MNCPMERGAMYLNCEVWFSTEYGSRTAKMPTKIGRDSADFDTYGGKISGNDDIITSIMRFRW